MLSVLIIIVNSCDVREFSKMIFSGKLDLFQATMCYYCITDVSLLPYDGVVIELHLSLCCLVIILKLSYYHNCLMIVLQLSNNWIWLSYADLMIALLWLHYNCVLIDFWLSYDCLSIALWLSSDLLTTVLYLHCLTVFQ